MRADLAWNAARMAAGGPSLNVENLHPDRLVRILRRHRLFGHSQCCTDRWTEAQRQVLRPYWLSGRARAMAHQHAWSQIGGALRSTGIRVTFIKGVAYQLALRGTSTGRDHTDLDLWTDSADLPSVTHILRSLGWHKVTQPNRRLRSPSQVSFYHPNDITIDLHHRLFAPRYSLHLVEDALRAHRSNDGALDVIGHGFLGMLHSAKDGWNILRHVADAHHSLTTLHQPTLQRLATRTRTRRAIDLAAALADEFIGPTGWESSKPVERRMFSLRARLRSNEPSIHPFHRFYQYLRCRESSLDQLQIVASTVFR